MIAEDDRFPRNILGLNADLALRKRSTSKATAVYPADVHWFWLDESECMLISHARFTHPSHPLINPPCPVLPKLNSVSIYE